MGRFQCRTVTVTTVLTGIDLMARASGAADGWFSRRADRRGGWSRSSA